MRFRHQEFESIRTYLKTAPADIRRLEWELNPVIKDALSIFALKPRRRAAAPPRAASIEEIEATFRRSVNPQSGTTVLSDYFHINAPPSDRAVSLAAAIEHVEAFGGPFEFLLAGYPEGGLISVSRQLLPFQEGAQDALRWAPDTRWGA